MSLHHPHTLQGVTPAPLALRTREAAEALGVSERMIQALTAEGGIPVVRLGRANLYPVRELRDWLTSQTMFARESGPNAPAVDIGEAFASGVIDSADNTIGGGR